MKPLRYRGPLAVLALVLTITVIGLKMGLHFAALAFKELWSHEALTAEMKKVAAGTGGKIEFYDLSKADEALKGADVLYTDVCV